MASDSRGDFHGNTLTSREVAGFVLREMVHKPGVSIAKHSHQCAHAALILRGAFTERCEGITLECRPLSVSFLAPGATHSDEFDNEVQLANAVGVHAVHLANVFRQHSWLSAPHASTAKGLQ
jgi:quercetin dioxygenase-like cupin family protein